MDSHKVNPIIVSKNIAVSPERIWKAITDVSEMNLWFFNNIPDFKAEIGFKTWFIVSNDDRKFYHLWEVISVEKNVSIHVEWTYPGFVKEPFLIVFSLKSEKINLTNFTVTAYGIEKFLHFNLPEFTVESCKGGWNFFTDNLKKYIEGSIN